MDKTQMRVQARNTNRNRRGEHRVINTFQVARIRLLNQVDGTGPSERTRQAGTHTAKQETSPSNMTGNASIFFIKFVLNV